MSDAKQNYAAIAESEFDLRREVERLRSINKDLLEACELAMTPGYIWPPTRSQWAGKIYPRLKEAVRKAKEGK